jgi:hypothetical protein
MAAQRAEVERVFEDPQVSEQWSKLVEWLDKYGAYWRDETLSLVTRVELLASAVLRVAERAGVDVHVARRALRVYFEFHCYWTCALSTMVKLFMPRMAIRHTKDADGGDYG